MPLLHMGRELSRPNLLTVVPLRNENSRMRIKAKLPGTIAKVGQLQLTREKRCTNTREIFNSYAYRQYNYAILENRQPQDSGKWRKSYPATRQANL
jgi:hypothetical protein